MVTARTIEAAETKTACRYPAKKRNLIIKKSAGEHASQENIPTKQRDATVDRATRKLASRGHLENESIEVVGRISWEGPEVWGRTGIGLLPLVHVLPKGEKEE